VNGWQAERAIILARATTAEHIVRGLLEKDDCHKKTACLIMQKANLNGRIPCIEAIANSGV
jgi:hypothetical protein